ncbi:MAG: response regulator transcription factor [Vogesella sp.]|uniref:response regulator transcription factor n=1 Tax=Vogesella sp. TaxID=1904252 RepID=UPI003918C037
MLFDEDTIIAMPSVSVPDAVAATRIFIVEDQPTLRSNLRQLLELEGYAVEEAADGASALHRLAVLAAEAELRPQLVLLDVGLPDMEGYAICRHLRQDSRLQHVPVIFLSGRVELEDRMAGYEAGAEDYIAKPYINAELLSKIGVALRNGQSRQASHELQGQVNHAMQAAFTAMTSASEIGVVLQFMKGSFALQDNTALQQSMLQALQELGLDASIQLRSLRGVSTINAEGPCGQLEIGLIETLARRGHIVDAGRVTVFSYGQLSLAVKNMPREDEERNGRLRDNLAFMAEGAAARLAALDTAWQQRQQAATLAELVACTREALRVVDERFRYQQWASGDIMLRLRESIDRAFVSLGLTEGQEGMIARLVTGAGEEFTQLSEQGVDVEASMKALLKALEASQPLKL